MFIIEELEKRRLGGDQGATSLKLNPFNRLKREELKAVYGCLFFRNLAQLSRQ